MRPNITALKQLRRVVENAPDDLLHMRFYRERSGCGTARCAAGWAAVDPWFNTHGFTADYDGAPKITGTSEYNVSDGLSQFFGIDEQQVCHLFMIDADEELYEDPHSVSKQQVLNQIDRLLRGEPTKPYRRSRADEAVSPLTREAHLTLPFIGHPPEARHIGNTRHERPNRRETLASRKSKGRIARQPQAWQQG